ncbi:hypothetical protein [Aeoliella mucimassa]|nr:hypothetical protein [Aeoliella mucimassa]
MPDPSPEEIAQACAEIRKGWSKVERAKRKAQKVDEWCPPALSEMVEVNE